MTVVDASPRRRLRRDAGRSCPWATCCTWRARRQPDGGADFEVLRADPMARNRYGGRFLQQEAGSALFEQLVEAARAERAARRARAEDAAATSPPAQDEPPTRGMHTR